MRVARNKPISNEDGTISTVINGETSNFRALRAQLSGRHRVSTRGDSETIVHLYEEPRLRFVKRLRGMFEVAVWYRSRRRVVPTRDRTSAEPLDLLWQRLFIEDGGAATRSRTVAMVA